MEDLFLSHTSTHIVPGRNLTWYAVFLASVAVYVLLLERSAQP